ncbi:hypothetical protein [Bradyrhizobium sp. JR3.5]
MRVAATGKVQVQILNSQRFAVIRLLDVGELHKGIVRAWHPPRPRRFSHHCGANDGKTTIFFLDELKRLADAVKIAGISLREAVKLAHSPSLSLTLRPWVDGMFPVLTETITGLRS